MASRESDLTIDPESGGTIGDEVRSVEPSSIKREVKNIWSRLTENRLPKDENIELLIDKNSEGEDACEVVAPHVEKNDAGGKHKNKKKAQKPPRPPNGPSLDAADRMLVKEFAVLAMKKRARVERMKALKKAAKEEKTSSFNCCIPALIITFLLFLVIIIQGISSRNTSIFQGSPEPAVGGSSGFISVQYLKSFPPYGSNIPDPPSVNSAA